MFHEDTFKTCSNGYVTALAILQGASREKKQNKKHSGSRSMKNTTTTPHALHLSPRYKMFRGPRVE